MKPLEKEDESKYSCYTNNGEVIGQQIALLEVVQRGDQFSLREITRRAKDHHDAGRTGVQRCLLVANLFCVLGRCHCSLAFCFLCALCASVVNNS